jgi:hypothetical protein
VLGVRRPGLGRGLVVGLVVGVVLRDAAKVDLAFRSGASRQDVDVLVGAVESDVDEPETRRVGRVVPKKGRSDDLGREDGLIERVVDRDRIGGS